MILALQLRLRIKFTHNNTLLLKADPGQTNQLVNCERDNRILCVNAHQIIHNMNFVNWSYL